MNNWTVRTICVASIAIGITGFAMAQNRQPTKGYIPDAAFGEKGINLDLVPDYFVVYARNGDVAGYARKTDHFVPLDKHSDRIEVVDDSLSRAVGHMVKGRGFVPLGTPEDAIPQFESQRVPPEEIKRLLAEKPAKK